MTTDITELALREKFEAWAEHACAAPWGYLKKRRTTEGYSEQIYTCMWTAWKAAGAELVEALEKSEKTSEARREAINRTHNMFVRERDRANAAEEALEKAQAKATQQGNIGSALFDEVTQQRRHADEKAPELRAQLIEADSEFEALRQRIDELESFRTAYMEWSDKTDWVNTDMRFGVVKPLGKHRADVLKAYIEHLESRTFTVKLPPKIERDDADGWFVHKGGRVGGGAAEWYNKALDDVSSVQSDVVTVKLPKPHAHLIWIQAGHAPDDFWDDVEVSHSEKDRCCDGSERYPVYARREIEEMLAATGIKLEAE